MTNSFPKKEKLKSKKVIEKLFVEGNSVANYPIKLMYLQVPKLSKNVKIQTGVAVPKKNFKSAVKRNRIKRLLREAYRLNKGVVFNNIEGNFAFLILYIGKEMPLLKDLEKNLITVLQKFIKQTTHEKIDE